MGDVMIDMLLNWAQTPEANMAVLAGAAVIFIIGAYRSGKTVLWGDMFAEEWDD